MLTFAQHLFVLRYPIVAQAAETSDINDVCAARRGCLGLFADVAQVIEGVARLAYS